jgi:hypothetical protein
VLIVSAVIWCSTIATFITRSIRAHCAATITYSFISLCISCRCVFLEYTPNVFCLSIQQMADIVLVVAA